MTTKSFAQFISASVVEVLEGFTDEQILRLIKPENLRKAFCFVLDNYGHEYEIQKFLASMNLEVVEDFEVGDSIPMKDNESSVVVEGSRRKGVTGGIRQAFYDLAHADEIPEKEWVFERVYTQTILRYRDSDNLFVLILYCDEDVWKLCIHSLN